MTQEQTIKISNEIAKGIIEFNDGLNEDDIYIRLEDILRDNNIEDSEKLRRDIIDYMFQNEKSLGLKSIIGVDNQEYLVSIKSVIE